ncbi:hypothetical protein Poli38472_012708 [Pythium oligandrum]|uniref:AAA+ ATPase domain-containing protein n=1 Tax=Pythium oligandrum TaxID=41045 RepID=A0A8K1FJ80_PYTOL|nr:hypothetical protein Poli38472_012708 [Pythium oligandrum]|eukprot:TMW61517.1 hypothetical protein Poli38472_012708 [Pythium oligandrum]
MDPSSMESADLTEFDGLLGEYRTGYALLDGILCLVALALVQQLIAALENDAGASVFIKLWDLVFKREDEERVIEITQRYDCDGYKIWDYDEKNHLLQKAIAQYIAERDDISFDNGRYELVDLVESDDEEDEYWTDSDDEDEESTTESEVYADSRVDCVPQLGVWVEVEPDIFFRHELEKSSNSRNQKGGTQNTVSYRLSTKKSNGTDAIGAFIRKAYTQYQEKARKRAEDDKSRYFYIQSGTIERGSDDGAKKTTMAYKRYALHDEKTFDNLFFHEKDNIMQLLDHFMNKTGKFAIKGSPYKLGFLLHGPPGTGKTSLIKAIAHHTKRHIVTINLSKIESNQELMDVMVDLKFTVHGMDTAVTMSMEDVIFVMEDIDCASSIVGKHVEEPTDPTVSNRQPKTDTMSDFLMAQMMMKSFMSEDQKKQKLNLAGLLNVLDCVIDCPGRIIIMTTNHPEKLDPALIRPGRVNKKLLLSYMGWRQVQQMIEYYSMVTLTDEQTQRLERMFTDATGRVSPAEVEELCAEYETVDAILAGLERLVATIK